MKPIKLSLEDSRGIIVHELGYKDRTREEAIEDYASKIINSCKADNGSIYMRDYYDRVIILPVDMLKSKSITLV